LADRAYRISLGGNQELCGRVAPPLAQAVLTAGSSKRGSRLASSCLWEGDAAALLDFKAGVAAGGGQEPLADWAAAANPCAADAWSGVACHDGRVVALSLADQGLDIASLEPLGRLDALQQLLLAGNNASAASLPPAWSGMEQLEVVDLSGTGVAGPLPPAWQAMRRLKRLLLQGNRLNGTLPAAWSQLSGLLTL
jgi:hypothetical protein